MDRVIVYPGAIPLDSDLLTTQRNTMIALGFLAQAALGTSTVVDGLACTQTTVASMTINVGPGSIMSLSTVDATAFGSLLSDSADALVKMGVNIATTQFTLTAPVSGGTSVNYLIEAALLEADGTPVTLPYYNAANPLAPYSGPGGGGAAQNTKRAQTVQLQAKAGTAATTGTQTTPAVDAGWVGLYVVTVAFGATSVVTGNISTIAGAPFLQFKVPALTPGFSRVQVFSGSGTFTAPAGVTKTRVTVVGGGGGGAGATPVPPNWLNAPGGGAGGAVVALATVVPGTGYAVTVGAAGASGGAADLSGGTGGTSSFASVCSATGGVGGTWTSGTNGAGGNPGVGSGGYLNLTGGYGGDGIQGTTTLSGYGGTSIFGGGGRAGVSGATAGTAPGSGGGGSYGSPGAGGAGAAGIVIVEW